MYYWYSFLGNPLYFEEPVLTIPGDEVAEGDGRVAFKIFVADISGHSYLYASTDQMVEHRVA